MIVKVLQCNICLESEKSVESLIGLEMNDNCDFVQKEVTETELHICQNCLSALYKFESNKGE